MQNQTLIQYFHWYYNEPDSLWKKATKEAKKLNELGITGVWFPPAYKGSAGGYSVGYDPYDLFDLGEFDQKNTINTKYGNKKQYLKAIDALHKHNISVLGDVVFNHKAGGDELEKIKVRTVNEENRNEFTSDVQEIEAWTKFTFSGRAEKYSKFIWNYNCFSGVDWSENLKETAIFSIQKENLASWEIVPSRELGNYDYLMFNDLDFRIKEVRDELKRWGKWYVENTNIDGFRFDAVKHISSEFLIEWMDEMKSQCNKEFFNVAEYWNCNDLNELENYIEVTGGRTQLFDSILHQKFFEAANKGSDYNLSTIFENTLAHRNPLLAVTFVDNHDSQPLQALESFIDFWFRPLAYAMILLREAGIPCVFYTDIYGANYEDNGVKVELIGLPELPQMLKVRENLAYGNQKDYLNHPNCIGWTRIGDDDHINSGLAVLLSNGDEGFKEMEVGKKFAGKIFIDCLGKRNEEVTINGNGWGEFFCEAGSVSVWILKD